MCHEYESGLLHQYHERVKAMFLKALTAHWVSLPESVTSRLTLEGVDGQLGGGTIVGNMSALHSAGPLPVVPDTAIHYRCGDNTVGHYGFLPFRAFKNLIPKDSKFIYIMSESSRRKARPDQRARCDIILKQLYLYVSAEFQNAHVLLMRGQDMFVDMYRLTFANVTICSVSTFCFWLALSSNGSAVHFPVSRLIAKATQPKYGANFHWITTPQIVSGVRSLSMSTEHLIKILKSK